MLATLTGYGFKWPIGADKLLLVSVGTGHREFRIETEKVMEMKAIELAAQIAARAPVAVRLGKRTINQAFELSLAEGLSLERDLFHMLFATEDQKEGMSAFIEKRPASWQGK